MKLHNVKKKKKKKKEENNENIKQPVIFVFLGGWSHRAKKPNSLDLSLQSHPRLKPDFAY